MGPQGPAGADGADGADAVASLVVEDEVTVFDDHDGTTVPLADNSANRMCFLTHVQLLAVDNTLTEVGACRVHFDAVEGWSLIGIAGSGNATVNCSARCLSW
jgi:hypothetical protein